MNADHWDRIAPAYDHEVFSVLANDTDRQIEQAIEVAGGARRIASDLGCGPGRFLPLLASRFRRVYAVDHSANLIDQARRNCADLTNVQYVVGDVARGADLPQVHLALSVNALLTPQLGLQRKTLDFYSEHVRPGGVLLLVVPSIESAHLSRQMLIEWNLREGHSPTEAIEDGFSDPSSREARETRQGVLDAGGVPTKHFLREELEAVLTQRRFRVELISKLEYPWTTEFHSPPEWMQSPGPWDWLVVARRRRTRRKGTKLQRTRKATTARR